MSLFQSKNPWELLAVAGFLGVFGSMLWLSRQPFTLPVIPGRFGIGKEIVASVSDQHALGGIALLAALGFVLLYIYVRGRLSKDRGWSKRSKR